MGQRAPGAAGRAREETEGPGRSLSQPGWMQVWLWDKRTQFLGELLGSKATKHPKVCSQMYLSLIRN